jgi:SAM-dependent methyltransferase
MSDLYRPLTACLLCLSTKMHIVVPLEPIPIATPNFAMGLAGERLAEALAGVPLDLYQCEDCGHVQVGQVGNPDLQYRDYVYTTSLSPGLAAHFAEYARAELARLAPPVGSVVVEIGSNDGTLLRKFQEGGMRVVGVDPARRIAAEATAGGIETIADFFSRDLARRIVEEHGKARIVIANNVIANVHDLVDFAKGIAELLDDDGAFLFETQYGADVVDRNLLDTVYHEHLSYFFVRPTAEHFERHGLAVTSIERISTKGGSIRVTVRRRGAGSPDASVARAIADEETRGMFAPAYFAKLVRDVAAIRAELTELVRGERAAGRTVAGYGVAVGTTTLLAQFGLMSGIDFLVDDDPHKAAALEGPGYSIPVATPARLLEESPGATIVFAWRYAAAIAVANSEYLAQGGRFVIPLPGVTTIDAASAANGIGAP